MLLLSYSANKPASDFRGKSVSLHSLTSPLYNYSAVELDLVNPPSTEEPTPAGKWHVRRERMGYTLTTYCYSTDKVAPVAHLIEWRRWIHTVILFLLLTSIDFSRRGLPPFLEVWRVKELSDNDTVRLISYLLFKQRIVVIYHCHFFGVLCSETSQCDTFD